MARSRIHRQRGLPQTTNTSLSKSDFLDYSNGFSAYVANDVLDPSTLRLAQNARISTLGRYVTRKGCDYLSNAAGETQDQSQASVTGAADQDVTTTTWKAQSFTAGSTGRLTKVTVNVKKAATESAPLLVELWSDDTGAPGTLLSSSSVNQDDIGSTYNYETARFVDAPQIASATDYWIVVRMQEEGSGIYNWSSTTSAITAQTTTDSGVNWAATSYDLNFTTHVSTDSPVLGLNRSYESDGTGHTVMAHGTTLYEINDATGVLTAIKTGLSASATKYRFAELNDKTYYVNGKDSPRVWDYTTDAVAGSGGTAPPVSTLIWAHQDLLFFIDATDETKLVFSNEDDYEAIASTNFIYVPSPKSPNPVIGGASLNGVLYLFTRESKWALFGRDKGEFQLIDAPANKGTFSQESIAVTRNHVYFAGEDGIYRFDGTQDELLSQSVSNDYEAIPDKSLITIAVEKSRLNVYYPDGSDAFNSKSLVFNIDYDSWESQDTNTHVSHAVTLHNDDDEYYTASSVVGQVFNAHTDSNNYSDVGKPIDFELRTRYEHFGNMSAKTRIKRWYPRFEAQTRTYDVDVGHDTDFRDSATYQSVSVGATGTTWGSGALWGAFVWGATQLVDERVSIPGTAKYTQLRVRKSGVDTPVEFIGHTIMYRNKRAR